MATPASELESGRDDGSGRYFLKPSRCRIFFKVPASGVMSCAMILFSTSNVSGSLTVLSAGHEDTVASLSAAENQKYEEVWQGLQPKLAALSSAGKQIIAEQSGHMVQFDHPDLVIEAIREMVETIRK